jgi:CheY-like chemotaxis protein
MVAKALLESQGLEADFVEDGQAAVDAVTSGAGYDLILMDVQMPVMDGQQATRYIRDWEVKKGAKRCNIVALTAGAFEDDRRRCADAGMDDFLAKPIELASLVSLLSRWLS